VKSNFWMYAFEPVQFAIQFLRKAAGFGNRLDIVARGDGDNEMSLLFPNGSRMVGLPGTEGTIRGFSVFRGRRATSSVIGVWQG
jgi:hypothetical protein